jgi:hypothetical protein
MRIFEISKLDPEDLLELLKIKDDSILKEQIELLLNEYVNRNKLTFNPKLLFLELQLKLKNHEYLDVLNIQLQGQYQNRRVWLFGKELTIERSYKLRKHSISFDWGYGGSAPAQLSLAICLEIFSERKALKIYQQFKKMYVSPLPKGDFLKAIHIQI